MSEENKRPWGEYEILKEFDTCKVKIINILPKKRLSYQYHYKRDENWVIVSGKAKVIIDGQDNLLEKGDHICIKREQKHRVENIGEELLVFIEVQTGEYFGEDDIVRIEDDYNRI